MGFFSSNLGLAEEFANPQVARTYEPDSSPQPLSTSAFSRNPFESLIQEATGGRGNIGGFNIPWTPDLGDGTSPIPPVGSPYEPRPTPGQPGTDTGGDAYSTGPSNIYGSDYDSAYYTDPMGNPLSELDQYILDLQNTTDWQLGLANMIPGFGMLSAAKKYSMGINPLYGSFLGNITGAQPTLDSYTGSTDYFGNPITQGQESYAGMMGGYANTFEQMAAFEHGWGSPEHLAAIEQTFADLPTATGEEPGFFDKLFDFTLPKLTFTAPDESGIDPNLAFYNSEHNWNNMTPTYTDMTPAPAPVPGVVHTVAQRDGPIEEGLPTYNDIYDEYDFEDSYSDWSDEAGVSYEDDWGGTWDDDFGWDDSDSDDGWG